MAYQAYGLFTAAQKPIQGSEGFMSDLGKGQRDRLHQTAKSSAHSPDKWFRVISWEYSAAAPVNTSLGTGVGNVRQGKMTIVKYFGPLSPVLMTAFGTRACFDFELNTVGLSGQKEPLTTSRIVIRTAVISGLEQFTGDPRLGSAYTTLTKDSNAGVLGDGNQDKVVRTIPDTHELERIEFTFQGIDIFFTGKLGKDGATEAHDKFASR